MKEVFKDIGAGIKDIRWVTDHRSGKFKGCGFIEFETEEACINAVKLNGTMLLGRNIRVDFSSDKPSRDHRDYEGRNQDEDGEEKREEDKDNEQDKNESKAEAGAEGSSSGDQQKELSSAPASLSSFLGQLSEVNASNGDGSDQVTGENESTAANDLSQQQSQETSKQQTQVSAIPTLPAGITQEMLAAMIANAQRVQQEQQQQAQQAQQQQPPPQEEAATQEPFGGY
jgi:RNA recognition motif-containing protein